MTVWVLKGPQPEMEERYKAASGRGRIRVAEGMSTYQECEYIAAHSQEERDPVRIVTSAYHVPRATLTARAVFLKNGLGHIRVQVWGVGTVTSEQAESEGKRIEAYQAKGDIATWSDAT